jgi:hypothetical protein
MPECQSVVSLTKWLSFLRNRWLSLLRNKWLNLLRNEWLSLVKIIHINIVKGCFAMFHMARNDLYTLEYNVVFVWSSY